MKKDKVILLFSGGFDSVALLHDLIYRKDYDVTLLFFSYGQANEQIELQHCNYWANKYDLPLETIVLNNFNWTNSNLYYTGNLSRNKSSEEDQYIEMRNLIFASYALSYSQSIGAIAIYSAIIAGYSEVAYPDSTIGFVKMFDTLSSMTIGVEFFAPYIFLNKYQVAQNMEDLDLSIFDLLDHSYSCNVPNHTEPCGVCPDCMIRKSISDKYTQS